MTAPRLRPVAVLVLAFALAGCGWFGPEYDEAAHRADVERVQGHRVGDWPAYLAEVRKVCGMSDQAFGYVVALNKDGGTLERLRVDVHHVCPEREEQLGKETQELSKDPCASPSTDAERRVAEAMGCPSPS